MMYKISPGIIAVVSLLMAACNNNTPANGTVSSTGDTTAIASVETNKSNTDYKPAFPGQTRAPGVKTQTAFEGKLLTKELNKPWGISSLPDGRLLITEKDGTMRIATSAGAVSAPITGLLPVDSDGQGGLLGVTIDPAFTTNRMVYWTYSGLAGNGNLTAVAKGKLSADEKTIENATMIYQATPAFKGDLHYGSRILFDKAGNLVVSTGERSERVTRPQAQFLIPGWEK